MSAYKTYTELHLAALLHQGDEEAFVEIYRRNWQPMFNAAYKRLKDEKLCEDLVQNVFTDLWSRRETLVVENLSAYLQTAVRFQAIKQSTRSLSSTPLIDDFYRILESPLRTEDGLIEEETLALVKCWIAALPEKRRKIFLMHYTEELSSDQIADILGISRKTVQNQIASATNNIRDNLSKILSLLLV